MILETAGYSRWPRALVAALAGLWLQTVSAAVPFAHQDSDLEPDPGVRYGVLDNGMRYALMANDTPSGQAAIRFRIDFGSLMEADDQRGLAHFIEHMAFNGSENVAEGEMIKLLERVGLAFGADTNASTGFEETIYQLDLPEVDDNTVDTALFLMRETADKLLFDPEAVDRERGVVLAEIRARNSPQFRAIQSQYEFLAPRALFPKRFPSGTPEVISNAPAEEMAALYRQYYRPERALMVIVGDFDVDAMEAKLQDRFRDWHGVGEPGEAPELGKVEPRDLSARIFVDPEIPTQLSASMVRPHEPRKDSAETRLESLLRDVGYGVINRRFQTLSRTEDAPFAGAVAGTSQTYGTIDHTRWGMLTQPEHWVEALKLGEQTVRRALQHGFSEAELLEQLANTRTRLENAGKAADTRSTPGLANGIVAAFSNEDVFTHPASDLELFETVVDGVTPESVLSVIRSEWAGSGPLIHLSISEPVEGGEEAVASAWRQSGEIAVAALDEAGAGEFAYQDFGPPGEVVHRKAVEDPDLVQLRFANNVMLNLKRTDFRDNEILVQVRFGGGRLTLPRDLAGMDTLIAVGFVGGGLKAHSTDELQRLMAGRAVGAALRMGGSALLFTGSTTPDDFLLQMQLWAAFLVAPGYRPEGYAQYRRIIDSVYDSLDATPQAVVAKDVDRLIHGGDPRFGTPPRAQLESLTYEQLRAFLRKPLAESAMEIAVVGDFDEEAVVSAVAATFGALGERAEAWPGLPKGLDVVFPEPDSVTLPHDGAADQAMALRYWPTTGGNDDRLYQGLQILSSVMQLRATDEIREQFGATYSPGVGSYQSRNYPDYGFLRMASDVRSDDLDQVIELFGEVAGSIGREPITDDELLRARQPVLEQLERNLESNPYWLSVIGRSQTRPEFLDSHRRARELIEAVTAEQLEELATRYVRDDKDYVVRIAPRAGEGSE